MDSPPVLREELAIPAHEDHSKEVIEWWDKTGMCIELITTPQGQAIYSELREKLRHLHWCDQHKVFNHLFHHDCPTS
jgi:hypothetical protein